MALRPIDQDLTSEETVLLRGFLQAQRDAMVAAVEGLATDELRERRVASQTTLAGLLRHLTDVEPWWFCAQFDGQDRTFPWQTDGNDDVNWRVPEDVTAGGLVADYLAACAQSDEVLDRSSLDEVARGPIGRRGAPPSLRWVLLHMIEETARHAGHADILREQVLADRPPDPALAD